MLVGASPASDCMSKPFMLSLVGFSFPVIINEATKVGTYRYTGRGGRSAFEFVVYCRLSLLVVNVLDPTADPTV